MNRLHAVCVTLVVAASLVVGAHTADASGLGRFVFVPANASGVIRVANFDDTHVIDSSNQGFTHPQWGPDGRIIASSSTGIRIIRKAQPGAPGKQLPGSVSGDDFPSMSPDARHV